MTLLELLVQKLPKRGGWPDGVARLAQDPDGDLQKLSNRDTWFMTGAGWTGEGREDFRNQYIKNMNFIGKTTMKPSSPATNTKPHSQHRRNQHGMAMDCLRLELSVRLNTATLQMQSGFRSSALL